MILHNLNYILLFLGLPLIGIFFYIFNKLFIQKEKLNILNSENEHFKSKIESLIHENNELSKNIEHYKSKIEYLEIRIKDQE